VQHRPRKRSCTAGEVLITGGLGSLGALIACWAASAENGGSGGHSGGSGGSGGKHNTDAAARTGTGTSHGAALRLLSRSGRPDPAALRPGSAFYTLLAAGNSAGSRSSSVTMERCDAGTAEDAADAMRRRRRRATTLLHAAGVLNVCPGRLVPSWRNATRHPAIAAGATC